PPATCRRGFLTGDHKRRATTRVALTDAGSRRPHRSPTLRGPGSDVDPIALTRELVQLETPTGREGPVVDYLARLLDRLGYRVSRRPVTPGRDNLYAYREPPLVVFSTHLDCVPP